MGPEEYVLCEEACAEIFGALDDRQCTVVLLTSWGYSLRDIGQMLHVSYVTVHNVLKSARWGLTKPA